MTLPALTGMRYRFADGRRSVEELAAAGQLESDPGLLRQFGFSEVRVASTETPYALALDAARDLIDALGIDPDGVGALLYTGAGQATAFSPGGRSGDVSVFDTLERFRYPGTRLQYDLGLLDASVLGIDQLACTGMFGAVRTAAALCAAEQIDRILCVSVDFFPGEAGREAVFNCTSDAACAVLVERGGPRCRIRASGHVTRGFHWDAETFRDEIVASYFPTAARLIGDVIRRAGWKPDMVDWLIPHNVGAQSWELLIALCGLEQARFWGHNLARDGHTLAGDNFINLADALASGSIRPGERLLLFSYGFGAHWAALAVEA